MPKNSSTHIEARHIARHSTLLPVFEHRERWSCCTHRSQAPAAKPSDNARRQLEVSLIALGRPVRRRRGKKVSVIAAFVSCQCHRLRERAQCVSSAFHELILPFCLFRFDCSFIFSSRDQGPQGSTLGQGVARRVLQLRMLSISPQPFGLIKSRTVEPLRFDSASAAT